MEAELADLAMQRRVGLEPLAVPLTPEQLTARLGRHHFVGGLCQQQVTFVVTSETWRVTSGARIR